jgi:gamma-glutamyltranspeptidase/glutathione hydrolase
MASLQDQGIAIDSSRVENYIPTWGQTDVSMYGYEEIHTVPRIGKGASFKAVWSAYKNAGADATAFRRLQATLAQNRPNLKGTTTFAIADVYGTGVSCALTMGQPFGDGAYLPEYGMSLSTNAALEDVDIQPVLMINPHVKELRAGGGASGGATGLAMAVAIARFGKTPDGMTVSGTADLLNTVGKTNLWACPKGIPPHPDSCRVAADAKGGGFGVVVGLNK